MKNSPYFRAAIYLLPLFSLSFITSCSDHCEVTNEYVYFQPVYTTFAEIKENTGPAPVQSISVPGRIYFKDNYLFINEVGKGIHIIDNRDQRNPKPVSFLRIPGNYDLAIAGNILFADSYIDLVAFDISNKAKAKEVGRLAGLFSSYGTMHMIVDPQRGVISDWKKVDEITKVENECELQIRSWGGYMEGDVALVAQSYAGSFNKQANIISGGATNGIGGSMARFTLANGFLYALDNGTLEVVDIKSPGALQSKASLFLAWDIETIFPRADNLFVGSQSGMHILDVSDPGAPKPVSIYTHIRSCDPVVVEGDRAYVTLRSGNLCGSQTNQLEVIDISDLSAPALLKMYPMTYPQGLGIDQNTLFICDGKEGLKVYDASDAFKVTDKLLAQYQNLAAFDIIPFQDVAMMIAEDGLYQYDYSNLSSIRLLSFLPVIKPVE